MTCITVNYGRLPEIIKTTRRQTMLFSEIVAHGGVLGVAQIDAVQPFIAPDPPQPPTPAKFGVTVWDGIACFGLSDFPPSQRLSDDTLSLVANFGSPDPPQPKPKIGTLTANHLLDNITPDFPQPPSRLNAPTTVSLENSLSDFPQPPQKPGSSAANNMISISVPDLPQPTPTPTPTPTK